jgi:tetratricopeptide (TPR) repeat protein
VRRLGDTIRSFGTHDARQFGKRLRQDPPLLTEYLEYRLDFTQPTKELLRFSTTHGIAGLALARLGTAALKLNDAPRASRLARRALAKRDERDSWAMATFVLATLDRRANRLRSAHAHYTQILEKWPRSYLVGAARENLALLEERFGNLPGALDHYTALGYREDVAYMIDARMPSGQLARYIDARPRHPKRSTLIFTLGMRYLREGKWSKAEATFGHLTEGQRRYLTAENDDFYTKDGLQDPTATLKALRGFDRQFRTARTRNGKAAALFAMGDYYYRHRDLVLYSLPAWHSVRAQAFVYSWNRAVALPADDRAVPRHHDEHEAAAHALRVFRRVVQDYPETSIAPRAAYWGACAANRLSNLNEYWRWRNLDGQIMREAVRLMRFADRSNDPAVAKKARKYHRVFWDKYRENRLVFANIKAPDRYWSAY